MAIEQQTPTAIQHPLRFPDVLDCHADYNRKCDTLSVRFGRPQPAVSVDVKGDAWVRILPLTGEIVGIEIENFQRVFLRKHADIAATWRAARPGLIRRLRSSWQPDREVVLQIVDAVKQGIESLPSQHVLHG